MQGFVFNTRRPSSPTARVREALGYLFDFEWTNKNLFYGAYTRTKSYFAQFRPRLARPAAGRRAEAPRSLSRARSRTRSSPRPMSRRRPTAAATSATTGAGARALQAKRAGRIKDEQARQRQDRRALRLRVPADEPEFERIILPFLTEPRALGIVADVRTVDPAQYENRLRDFDFDMIVAQLCRSRSSPGNEQRDFCGSKAGATSPAATTVGHQATRWSTI